MVCHYCNDYYCCAISNYVYSLFLSTNFSMRIYAFDGFVRAFALLPCTDRIIEVMNYDRWNTRFPYLHLLNNTKAGKQWNVDGRNQTYHAIVFLVLSRKNPVHRLIMCRESRETACVLDMAQSHFLHHHHQFYYVCGNLCIGIVLNIWALTCCDLSTLTTVPK